MRMTCYLILFLFLTAEVSAQLSPAVEKKLSILLRNASSGEKHAGIYIIAAGDMERVVALIKKRPSMRVLQAYNDYNLLYVHAPGLLSDTVLLSDTAIRFVDVLRVPKEEKAIDGFDPGTNSISQAHSRFPSVNGTGKVVSIKEKLFDTGDIDFKGRYFLTPVSTRTMTTHATNMATMIAGGGNSDPQARGVAWGAGITSSDFLHLIPDSLSVYKSSNISVQNHSYGTGIENYYGADAAAYDKSVQEKTDLVHVFSSGNAGDQSAASGRYQNLSGFANLTGSFKMSKNTVTVGAIDSFYQIEALSSRGPAHDGRLKPELVAYGQEGSSGAAAIVSGTALLLQQLYHEEHSTPLEAAMAKAILINTADDVGAPGIDFESGYGSVNVEKAVAAMVNGKYFSGTVSHGTIHEKEILVPAGTAKLKITLGYTDIPAIPNADKALVNDVDLLLTNEQNGASWMPWVLNIFPHIDSLQQPPTRKKDTLNTVEQVSIDFPEAGMYKITVRGFNVSGSQPFSIAYEMASEKTLYWTYPTAINDAITGSTVVLRWASTFPSGKAMLESTTDGVSWKVENTLLDIAQHFFKWKAPEISGWVQLRITYNGENFISDTFAITQPVQPTTGFHCADSALLFWNAAGVNSYRVYQLGEKYLQEVAVCNDTSIILNNLNGSEYFAIAPLLSSTIEGRRSYAFDYTMQGAGCYVNTFLADNMNGLGQLTVLLGSTFNLHSVTIEKWGSNGFTTWKSLPAGSLSYRITDSILIRGMNVYRLKIELFNQQVIYSQPASLFNFSSSEYILYPNPAKRNSVITLASKDADDVVFRLYDATGSMIMEVLLTDNQQQLPTAGLPQGIYFYNILKKGKSALPGRIIIQ